VKVGVGRMGVSLGAGSGVSVGAAVAEGGTGVFTGGISVGDGNAVSTVDWHPGKDNTKSRMTGIKTIGFVFMYFLHFFTRMTRQGCRWL